MKVRKKRSLVGRDARGIESEVLCVDISEEGGRSDGEGKDVVEHEHGRE